MASRLYDTAPLQPLVAAGFVLLTPNYRLARRIKSDWDSRQAAAGMRVWEPLPVMPLEAWLMQRWQQAVAADLLPARVLIGRGQAVEVWRQVIAGHERASEVFHLLRPTAAAEAAQQARDTLLRWEVDCASPEVRQLFDLDADCSTYLRWLDAFEQRMVAAGLATAADCIYQLRDGASQLPRAKAALLEFEDVPPLLWGATRGMCSELEEIKAATVTARRVVHCFPEKRLELQAVASRAAQSSRERPGATFGIVLTDTAADRPPLEYLLRREFDCLGDDYTSLPVNFSEGMPLDRVPVVRDALAALAMALPTTTPGAVVSLLRSRFLALPDATTPLANLFVTRLFESGRAVLPTAEVRHTASATSLGDTEGLVLGQRLMELAGRRELRQRLAPSDWVIRFCEALALWGWPAGDTLDSLEYQQVELWYRSLDEFCSYDAVCGPLDYAAALQLLRGHCNRQISQPRTEDSAIQVLGPLEAAGLAFDELWVVGMQAGNWPAPARPNPFIPLHLQRRLDMPHATPEREWQFASGLMSQYAGASRVLHASYCSAIDGIPELPSALLAEFEDEHPAAGTVLDPRWLEAMRSNALVPVEDRRAPAVSAAELAVLRGGSALLEDQSHCPFRAFARRRLLVEPLGAPVLGLSAAERGSLLHAALYRLWGELGDLAGLLAKTEDELAAVVAAAATAAVEELPARQRHSLGARYWQLEQTRLATLLAEWLQVERQRGEFAVHQREQVIDLQLDRLAVRLRVDRIDLLPDGSQLIIDYKSGTGRVQDWLGDRPARPQLPLYSVAVPDAAAALAFAQLRPRECRFVGLGRCEPAAGIRSDIEKAVAGSVDADSWEALNARWGESLKRLAADFMAGEAAVDPLGPASCTWCGLQPLCRIGSREEEQA